MENCPSKQLRDHLHIFSKLFSAAALYQMEKVLTFHSSNMIKVIELALNISVGKVCIYSHTFLLPFDYSSNKLRNYKKRLSYKVAVFQWIINK